MDKYKAMRRIGSPDLYDGKNIVYAGELDVLSLDVKDAVDRLGEEEAFAWDTYQYDEKDSEYYLIGFLSEDGFIPLEE